MVVRGRVTVRPLLALGGSAMWLGASTLLGASVAPAAFAALPSPGLAGAVVGRVLPVVFVSGLVLAIVVGVLGLGDATTGQGPLRTAAAVWALACGAAQFGIGPAITHVRASVAGSIDALATDDPGRVAFGRLHMASVGLLGVAMIAALVVAGVAFAAARSPTTH